MKGMQIMQMQQQAAASSDDLEVLTKQQVMDTFRVSQQLQMESMDAMMADGM